MEKVITESQDYTLMVGVSTEAETPTLCYQLVNRVHEVIEVETQLLPQAYEYLEQLQSALDARRDSERAIADALLDASTSAVANSH